MTAMREKTRIFAHKVARELSAEELEAVSLGGGTGVTYSNNGAFTFTSFCGSGQVVDDASDGTPL